MDEIINFFRKQRYALLLLFLLLFQVIPPLLESFPFFRKLSWGLLFTLVMAAATYTEGKNLRTFKPMLLVGGPTLLVHWLLTFFEGSNFLSHSVIVGLAIALYLTFFGFLFFRVLRHIFITPQITLNTLFAAMAGYWLLGMTAGLIFIATERLSPGSFTLAGNDLANDLMYYAFITLTTVGYGDILPIHPFARMVAVNLAIFGQMYMTILLAFLVGKFASGEGENLIEKIESPATNTTDDTEST